MNGLVVLISGKQGSGKTSLVHGVYKYFGGLSHKFIFPCPINYAEPLYRMHNAVQDILRGYGLGTIPKDGELLQLLGTEWGRKCKGENFWVNIMHARIEQIEKHTANKPLFLIGDARFPNEITAFPDALTVRLECPEKVRRTRIEKTPGQYWRMNTNHPSEISLDGYEDWDVILDTNAQGLEECVSIVVDAVLKKVATK